MVASIFTLAILFSTTPEWLPEWLGLGPQGSLLSHAIR